MTKELELSIGQLRRLFTHTNNHHVGYVLEVAAGVLEYAKSLELRLAELEGKFGGEFW